MTRGAALTTPSQAPNIEDRVGYLSRALANASATVEAQLLSKEIKDELDVCKLQLGVARAFTAVEGEEDAKLALERSLVRPSALYNDYAIRLGLWEECIEIIRVCGAQEQNGDDVLRLYDSILSPAVVAWDEMQLETTVKHLAQRFYSKDHESFAFPLEYVVATLEEKAVERERLGVGALPSKARETRGLQLQWSNAWLAQGLFEGGVRLWRLFVAYARNYVAVTGRDSRRTLYASRALCHVAEVWAQNPGDIAEFDRFVHHALPLALEMGGAADVLERCVFHVGGLQPGVEVAAQEIAALVAELKAVLARLRRVAGS